MITLILVVAFLALIYTLAIKPFSYWKNSVPTATVVPFFGDFFQVTLHREHFIEMIQRVYSCVESARYIGSYEFRKPVLYIKSPELIKQICVKDFDHFLDHRKFIPEGIDELMSKNLVALTGQNWKTMRSTVSPTFTSSKMKTMFVLICHNAELFVKYFLEQNDDVIEVEFKEAFTRYSSDLIASVAFGIQVDSLKDRDNEFFLMGRDASNFNTPQKRLALLSYQIFPAVARILRLSLFGGKIKNFFIGLVKDTIKMREENNIKRPDMLGILMEARKSGTYEHSHDDATDKSFAAVEEHLKMLDTKVQLTDADIASQVFVFFIAGFETVSTAMCFLLYELAINPDVQTKLIEEIDESGPKDKPPTYDIIANSTYLDMVVTESLRKWPTSVATDRVVTKPFTIEPELPNEQPLHLEVNDAISIPIYAIHHDPKYYPEPNKFEPERFSPENRQNIDPYTYLSFGVGPRNCIGSRFALLEIKTVIFYILRHFEVIPIETTNIPLKLNYSNVNLGSVNGFPLGLKRR